MSTILIAERNEGWGFWQNGNLVIAPTPFLAAVAARVFGETLKDENIGYEIVLDTGSELITLHTRQFAAEDALTWRTRTIPTSDWRLDAEMR